MNFNYFINKYLNEIFVMGNTPIVLLKTKREGPSTKETKFSQQKERDPLQKRQNSHMYHIFCHNYLMQQPQTVMEMKAVMDGQHQY